MPLKDLVAYLGNKRASGTLHVERGAVRKQVVVLDGQIINASSNQPREYLGQFLINMGHLTEDQLTKAFQTQRETQILIGKILVMIGIVSEEVVMNALSLKMRETVLEAFKWKEGNFNFDATPPALALQGLDIQVDLTDVEREGEFRETAWEAISAVFPHGNLKLAVNPGKLPERPKPGSLDEKLVASIHEGHTIDDMVLALHATDFFVYQRLYALYRLEVVTVAEDTGPATDEDSIDLDVDEPLGGPAIATGEPTDAELAHTAETFLSQRNFREAESTARRAFDRVPSPGNAELLRRTEEALASQLRDTLIRVGQVPVLLVNNAKLKSLGLSAPEKYLLSRVDGRRDVGAIVHVSPLQELEALKLFQRFVEGGLIQLRAG